MRLLLDTHALLWWLDDAPELSATARAAIAGGDNVVFVSAATIWEIRIKQAIGKLQISADFEQVLDDQGFDCLDVTSRHAHALANLPLHHRDPFDRMLIAQARVERLKIITLDASFSSYDVPLIAA
ncbi:MAG: type II toxin-antitoxin system VapC family toxin [bacterium]|nr:type II toxin-antitoxin system VapC family toxin [bacterium]